MKKLDVRPFLDFKFELQNFLSLTPKPKENIKAKAIERLELIKKKHIDLKRTISVNRLSEVYRKFLDTAPKGGNVPKIVGIS